jgi:hypothetical protein
LTFKRENQRKIRWRIQDGDFREEADSVSSINQKSCRDAGATHGRKKLLRKIKTPTP